eukprot:2263995-Pleurochrysis_carterae.AAC.1
MRQSANNIQIGVGKGIRQEFSCESAQHDRVHCVRARALLLSHELLSILVDGAALRGARFDNPVHALHLLRLVGTQRAGQPRVHPVQSRHISRHISRHCAFSRHFSRAFSRA